MLHHGLLVVELPLAIRSFFPVYIVQPSEKGLSISMNWYYVLVDSIDCRFRNPSWFGRFVLLNRSFGYLISEVIAPVHEASRTNKAVLQRAEVERLPRSNGSRCALSRPLGVTTSD